MVFSVFVLQAAPVLSAELYGAQFPQTVDVGTVKLELAGLGVLRYMYFIKIYVAALYLGEGVDPQNALADVPKRLEFEYEYSLAAGDFQRGTIDAIEYQNGPEALQRFGPKIDELNSLYSSVDPGDRYAVTYMPGIGMEVALNGVPQGVVEGADFARTFFAIWLADDKPLDTDLRNELLAKS